MRVRLLNPKFIVALISGLIPILQCHAQKDRIINYLQNDIEINQQIWGIHSNPNNGMVYFATNLGLLEYDGLSFKTWQNATQKSLRSVLVDSTGRVYTGGFESFGYWDKSTDCSLIYHSLTDSFALNKNDEIWKIYSKNNVTYFQSFTAIYKYQNNTVTRYEAPSFMLFMFEVHQQFLVQVYGQGLYYFNDDQFRFIEGSERFRDLKIHAIIPYKNRQMLVCTEKNGIYVFDGSEFKYWETETSEYLKDKNCNSAISLNDSIFAFGTILDGIILTNNSGEINEHYNYGNGLNNNTVLSLCVTKKNGLWVGLDEGANFINKGSSVNYFTTATGSLGTLYTILIDKNTLYMGSNHGLFRTRVNLNGESLQFNELTMVPNSQGQVWFLNRFGEQIICGHNEGTFTITENGFEKISNITGGWSIKPYNDLLIEGTYTGLITFKQDASGKWKFATRLEGFYEPTRHIEIDYLGYLWVSHPQKGIYKLQPNENFDSIVAIEPFTYLKTDLGITDVYKLNNRVVFSSGNEFYTYDYVNNKMVAFTALNNALGEYRQASQIISNEKNQYWFVYKNKLALFRISIDFEPTKICEYLITDANMPGQDLTILAFNQSAYMVTNRNGLAILKNNETVAKDTTPSVFVKSIFFHGKNKNITLCPGIQATKVPNYLNNVRFDIADPEAIHFTSPVYHYRIREIEDLWNNTSSPFIHYYHLKPGTYHLQLASENNPQIIETAFTILKPWYLNIWAFVAYYLVLTAIVYLVARSFKRKLLKQRQLLEFEVKQTSLENRLQNANVELMLTLRYLIQKNESLENLRNELTLLKEEPGSVPTKVIKRFDAHITQGLELQTKEWKMALHNLKLSQEGYFKMLKEKYPKLTNNDIRLCSYLRMNFNSKEIAHLLNISTRAVEISRYRLRKKLNLEHDKNLTDFLMQDEI